MQALWRYSVLPLTFSDEGVDTGVAFDDDAFEPESETKPGLSMFELQRGRSQSLSAFPPREEENQGFQQYNQKEESMVWTLKWLYMLGCLFFQEQMYWNKFIEVSGRKLHEKVFGNWLLLAKKSLIEGKAWIVY